MGGHRSHWPAYTNVVSTHFFLDNYEKVKDTFETIDNLDESKRIIMQMIWGDLSNAYKFGSLVRVDETLDKILPNDDNHNLFAQQEMEDMFSFQAAIHESTAAEGERVGRTWQQCLYAGKD